MFQSDLAETLLQLSRCYNWYSQLGGDNNLNAAKAKEKALSSLKSAIDMFSEVSASVSYLSSWYRCSQFTLKQGSHFYDTLF